MNSTVEAILRKLKQVTKEVSFIATILLPAPAGDGKTLTQLLKKLQKEKDVLVKKLERATRDSK